MTTQQSRTIWLALLMLLMAGNSLRADDAEKRAVKAVERIGGAVTYGKLVVGEFVFNVVTEVTLVGQEVRNTDLKGLAAFTQLHSLSLWKTAVTDVGLMDVASLKQLHSLNLSVTEVTDAGLKELGALKHLQTLNLSSTEVTDAGLKELAVLKQLQWLDLCFTKVTDAGAAELQKALPNLKIIR